MQVEDIYSLNQWCSGSDLRPQALQQAAEREAQLRREQRSLTRFRSQQRGNAPAPEQVAALESQLLDARAERERLGAEWAMSLLAAQQQRRRAVIVPVMVEA